MLKLNKLIILTLLLLFSLAKESYSQTRLSVQGAGRLYPIAVPQLCVKTGDSSIRKSIPSVIAKDLDLSGYFEVMNPAVYIEEPGKCDSPNSLAYTDWSVIGVEGLVKGVVTPIAGGRVRIQMYLHDVQVRRVVLGKEYEADPLQAKAIAHKFSNEIMKFFTGIPGVFGTKIAYSSKVGRFKELFVMDMDGSNVRQLTSDRGLSLSSSWLPKSNSIVFTSYRNRVPNLFTIDVDSKRTRQITQDKSLELGAQFTNDGSSMVLSRTIGRDSDIVLMSSAGAVLRRLTATNGSIDVSPSLSPDNRNIAFVSNRSGGPQIYTMTMQGSGVKRISYANSDYCTSPAWSPLGKKIAFVCRADRGFQLFVANADGSSPSQLTSRGRNEDPSWAPNGQYLVFSSTFGKGNVYNLALIKADGTNLRQVSYGRSGDTDPSWSSLLP